MDCNTELMVLLVVLLALLLVGYVRLYRHYRRNLKKVSFLFDSIDNVDFAFRFPTENVSKDDRILNQSLNRIKLVLQHARDEQMEREKYYEQIINSVDTGIMVVDGHDKVLQHNRAALRALHVEVLTHLNQVRMPLKDNRLAKHETPAMLRGKPVRIITLSNVSQELSNQEIDSWVKLIRVLTHEIMNTITPITSLCEILLKKVMLPSSSAREELLTGLSTIHKTGAELLSFVNNYRRFTHVPTPHPSLFYVEPFLKRMVTLCGHEAVMTVTPKDLIAYGDESLMAHVVTNILKNAVEAGAAHIWLKAYSDEREAIVMEISNDAGLIPEDVEAHIFVPFFTTKKEGSGIGLSLSRQIMRVCGGSLSLSQDKEKGITTFSVVIP